MFEKFKLKREQYKLELLRIKKFSNLIKNESRFKEESSWTILNDRKEYYSESEHLNMQEQAKNLFYKNPLARGIIRLTVNFVIGSKCSISPVDTEPIICDFWNKFAVANKFDLKLKEILRRILRDGEIFIRVFYTNDVDVPIKIRFIDPKEIKSDFFSYGIETNPNDVEDVKFYHRSYSINNVEYKEKIPANEIIHYKYNVDSNEKRGMSFFVGIAKDIVSYRNWLDDRIHLNKLRSMFALIGKPLQSSVTSTKDLFTDSSYLDSSGTSFKKNEIKPGAAILSKGIEWDFKSPNLQAWDTRYDGRAILLMIAAGSGGLPEYMVTGDASNSNYSSTLVSESPGVKLFESFQDILEKIICNLYFDVISYGIKLNYLPKKTTQNIYNKDNTSTSKFIETNKTCNITFPILIHRNLLQDTKAIEIQMNLGILSKKTASAELGRDYDKEKIEIDKYSDPNQDSKPKKNNET